MWTLIVDGKSAKMSDASADPALLHKKMLQLLSSLWVTRAVGSFARLGLADVMADGAKDAPTIAAARGLSPDRVYRLLRALSTVGIVAEPTRGRFTLTPLGALLGSRLAEGARTTAIFLNDYFADMWTHLDDALVGDRTAFEALKGRADALYVATDPLVTSNRIRINTLALAARLPTSYGTREYVEAGGLMSYGANQPDLFRRAGDYVDKILRGTKPADLPVEQPTKFELVINLTTAKALGLTVPPTLIARADEVIE